MMGKKGLIRSMNSMRIDGSMKMVISIGTSGHEGTVSIPKSIADSVTIPVLRNVKVKYQSIQDGDQAILVRQPCLWSGGIQPVTIRVDAPCFSET
jgi:hypothetical protein